MPEISFLRELEGQLRDVADRDALAPKKHATRRWGVVGVCGTAVVAVLAFAVIGSPLDSGGSRLDAAANAAVAPPGLIEHTVEWTKQLESGNTVTVRQELWSLSNDPSVWRSLTDDPATGGRVEQAEDPGEVSSYSAGDNVIYQRTKPSNWKPLQNSAAESDLNAVRVALAYSNAKDAGPTTMNGQAVERFDFGSRETNGQTCSYYATREDLRPVAIDCTNLIGHPWLSSHKTFEWLDQTPTNNAFLSLPTQHPNAQIDRAPLGVCEQGHDYFGPQDPRNAPCVVNAPGG
jgi:hypothetical protein